MNLGPRHLIAANGSNRAIRYARIVLRPDMMKSRLTGRLRRRAGVPNHSPQPKCQPLAARQLAQLSVEAMAVKPVLLVVYLIGAVCTAWCLNVPTVSRELRPFLSISSIIWPLP